MYAAWIVGGSGGRGLGLLLAGPGRADFLITVGDITLPVGSSGFVPVTISSTALGGQPSGLHRLSVPDHDGQRRLLEFQDSPFPDPTFTDPNYVFFGDSANEAVMRGGQCEHHECDERHVHRRRLHRGRHERHRAASLPAKLLVDLPVTAVTALAGDTFSISLVPRVTRRPRGSTATPASARSGTFPALCQFSGHGDDHPGGPGGPAVPEPASFLLLVQGAVCMASYAWRRQRGKVKGQRTLLVADSRQWKARRPFSMVSTGPQGRTYWVGRLVAGDTVEQVVAGFLNSPEYIQSRTDGGIDSWLDAFSSDVLGRPVTAAERTAAENAFNTNHESRAQIASDLFLAAPAAGQTANEYELAVVRSDYQQLLDRPSEPEGLQFWAVHLQEGIRHLPAGLSDEQLLAAMIGETNLQEFYRKTAP